jgi:hypothetical protein
VQDLGIAGKAGPEPGQLTAQHVRIVAPASPTRGTGQG